MKMPFVARHIIVAITLLSSFPGHAQKSNVAGYYISLNSDTVRGTFIGADRRMLNLTSIKFQPASGSATKQLTADDAEALNLEGIGSFVAYKGKRLVNSIDFQTATTDENDHYEDISAFLKLIAQANGIRFFSFEDENRLNLFYQQNGGPVTELEQKGALRNNNYWQSMTFKEQLRELFLAETNERVFDNLSYTAGSIAAFVKNHGGNNLARQPKNKNEGLMVFAGASINSFEYAGTSSPDFVTRWYKSNTVPVFGLGYMFSLQTKGDRFFLSPQVKVFSYKHESHVTYNNAYPNFTTRFQSSLIVSPALYGAFKLVSSPALNVFIMPGVNVLFLGNNKQTEIAVLSASETKTTATSLRSAAVAISGQTMALIGQKVIVWSAYNLPANVNTSGLKANLSSVQLGLGYKIF